MFHCAGFKRQRRLQIVQFSRCPRLACGDDNGDDIRPTQFLYGKPTAAALEANEAIFRSPYSAADAPEVLFRQIEDCAEIATLDDNPYTDKLILTAVRHLLTTGLYIRAFKDWDQLTAVDQTWLEIRHIIQDAFERRLNAMVPTAGHK